MIHKIITFLSALILIAEILQPAPTYAGMLTPPSYRDSSLTSQSTVKIKDLSKQFKGTKKPGNIKKLVSYWFDNKHKKYPFHLSDFIASDRLTLNEHNIFREEVLRTRIEEILNELSIVYYDTGNSNLFKANEDKRVSAYHVEDKGHVHVFIASGFAKKATPSQIEAAVFIEIMRILGFSAEQAGKLALSIGLYYKEYINFIELLEKQDSRGKEVPSRIIVDRINDIIRIIIVGVGIIEADNNSVSVAQKLNSYFDKYKRILAKPDALLMPKGKQKFRAINYRRLRIGWTDGTNMHAKIVNLDKREELETVLNKALLECGLLMPKSAEQVVFVKPYAIAESR
jgi:hypothetical protein